MVRVCGCYCGCGCSDSWCVVVSQLFVSRQRSRRCLVGCVMLCSEMSAGTASNRNPHCMCAHNTCYVKLTSLVRY